MKICPTCKTKYSTNVFYCPLEGSKLVEDYESGTAKSMIGTILDERYQVVSRLGEGGMGAVYLVEHVTLKKRMAVKVLRDEYARKEELVKRFQQEAVAASRIGQENIIDVTDFGRTGDGNAYFVMELLDGPNLADVIKEAQGVPLKRTIPILQQMCSALSAAHKQGIIHRDLKPENIVLIKRGSNSDFVKILDFGISKMIDTTDGRAEKLTALGMIVGTPEYMSPEQASGVQVDLRTDIYSMGIIIYEMLTGRLPFIADNALQILSKHINEMATSPRAVRPDLNIPPKFEELVLRCIEKQRDRRPQTMDEIHRSISEVLDTNEPRSEPRKTMAWDTSEVPMPSALRQAVAQKGISFTGQSVDSADLQVPQPSETPRSATAQFPGVQPKKPTIQESRVIVSVPEAEPPPTPTPLPVPPEASMAPEYTSSAEEPAQVEPPAGDEIAGGQSEYTAPSIEPPAAVEAARVVHEEEDLVPGRHRKSRTPLIIAAAAVLLAAAGTTAYFVKSSGGKMEAPPTVVAPAVEKKPEPPPPAPPPTQVPAPVEKKDEPNSPVQTEEEKKLEPAQQPSHRAPRREVAAIQTAVAGEVSIEIETSPSVAEVYRGRDFIGTTPVRLHGKRDSEETVTLKKDGYEAQKVVFSYDKTRSIKIDLKSSGKPAQQPTKKKEELFHKLEDIKNPFK